ncbi:MAG TPA: hypothetical protein VKA67_08870, partial [Verrucomicrobiae bacterium]|nr:hypothetical protein [Verrucomicrobiae bacterium]
FYTEKDVVFDARLLGTWQEKGKPNDPEIWKFEKSGTNVYHLTVWEPKNKHGQFDAHLFKLKKYYFLDIIPTDCDYSPDQAELVAASMYPGHLLVRVSEFEPELKLAFFDFNWLQKYLEKNPKALAHHTEDKRIVLTASTRELQKFVLNHLVEGELFAKPGEMIPKTGEAPPAPQPEEKQ